MKKIIVILLNSTITVILILLSCKSQITNKHEGRFQKNDNNKKIFQYNLDKTNWLTVDAIINGKDTGIFVLDNNTRAIDLFHFDLNFALQKGLISNNYGESIKQFQDTSFINLSFGTFNINSRGNGIGNLPHSENIDYAGIIGLGFLKNYIVEISYIENYFCIDSTLSIDTFLYQPIILKQKAYNYIPIEFYTNGKKYLKNAILDIGYAGDGFFWGGGAGKDLIGPNFDSSRIEKKITTMSGEINHYMPFQFDSISIPGSLTLSTIPSRISLNQNGLSGSDVVLFGNSFLKRFKKIYIDFRTNKLYLPRHLN